MQKYIDNKVAAAILPLVPLCFGMFLKFSIVDKVPNAVEPTDHIYNTYLVGAWVEVISISIVGAIVWAYAIDSTHTDVGRELMLILIVPFIVAFLCAGIYLGAPKMQFTSSFATVHLPNILSVCSLCWSSIMIREVSK